MRRHLPSNLGELEPLEVLVLHWNQDVVALSPVGTTIVKAPSEFNFSDVQETPDVNSEQTLSVDYRDLPEETLEDSRGADTPGVNYRKIDLIDTLR